MVSNHFIHIRVSKEQLERIKSDARNRGYPTTGSYLRDLAFSKNNIESKMIEMSFDVGLIKELLVNGRRKGN